MVVTAVVALVLVAAVKVWLSVVAVTEVAEVL